MEHRVSIVAVLVFLLRRLEATFLETLDLVGRRMGRLLVSGRRLRRRQILFRLRLRLA
jgi:hypothetical protein